MRWLFIRPFILLLAAAALQAEEARKIADVCSAEDIQSLGLDCAEDDPCPVFLELSSAEGFGANVFVTGNLHTVDTTISGVLLASDDAGKTWTEPVKRILSAEFDQIQFADPQHGWVSGVKLSPLPRDPFLLLTANGGEMWHPVSLFPEPTLGAIQQFWFDSPFRGQLVVDRSQGQIKRYERYTSADGGETWTLKETTEDSLRVINAKDGPNWRAVADADAYRVERRTLTGWETLARFAIHAGDCK